MSKSWVLNSADEMETFNTRDFWIEEDGLVESLTLSLSPHSGLYFSDLSPIFSYEIQKMESLNLFSHLHLRDGASLLLNFFLNNPKPSNIRTKISIHESLKDLVPSDWRDQVQFIELVSLRQASKKRAYYIMGSSVGFDTFTHVQKIIDGGIEEVVFLASMVGTLGSSERASMGAQFISLSNQIIEKFSSINIKFEELKKINLNDVSQSLVAIDRDLFNYCSDSYVAHLLLSQGACTEALFAGDPTRFIELGLNYGQQLVDAEIDTDKSKELWDFIQKMNISSSNDRNVSREFGQLEQYLNPALIDLGRTLIEGKFFKK